MSKKLFFWGMLFVMSCSSNPLVAADRTAPINIAPRKDIPFSEREAELTARAKAREARAAQAAELATESAAEASSAGEEEHAVFVCDTGFEGCSSLRDYATILKSDTLWTIIKQIKTAETAKTENDIKNFILSNKGLIDTVLAKIIKLLQKANPALFKREKTPLNIVREILSRSRADSDPTRSRRTRHRRSPRRRKSS